MSSTDYTKTEPPPQYNTGHQQPPVSYPPPAGYPPYNNTAHYGATVVMPALSNPPRDYLTLSIVTTFCCCFFIGIFAIIKSQATKSAILNGNQSEAEAQSQQAKIFNIVNICVGLAFWIVIIAYAVWSNTYIYSIYDY